MSYGNIFTMWKYGLRPDQIRDVQRWYGEVVNTPGVDSRIGMHINGISWDYSFAAIDNQLVPLRRGFVPRLNSIAAAVGTQFPSTMGVDVGGIDKTVKLVTGNHSVGSPSVSFRPGKALVGQDAVPTWVSGTPPIRWDEVDTDENIADIARSMLDTRKFMDSVVRGCRSDFINRHLNKPHTWLTKGPDSTKVEDWRDKLLGTNLATSTTAGSTSPEPAKSREEIYRDLERCQEAIAEVVEAERRRNLTNGQIMQLCAYFRLYSFGEIIQFIEDHKR